MRYHVTHWSNIGNQPFLPLTYIGAVARYTSDLVGHAVGVEVVNYEDEKWEFLSRG